MTSVMSQAETEREEMRQQLSEERRQCRGLLKQIAILRKEQQLHVASGGGKRAPVCGCAYSGVYLGSSQVGPQGHSFCSRLIKLLDPFQILLQILFQVRFTKP